MGSPTRPIPVGDPMFDTIKPQFGNDIAHTDGQSSLFLRMATVVSPDLPSAEPLYRTPTGTAYVGDSLAGMREHLEDESVALFMMSPPFALTEAKEYGNKSEDDYIAWFREFAEVMWDKLKPNGSVVIDLGGAWRKGQPTRSLYQFKVLLELCENLGEKNYFLAQEFYWYNPSKMPLPAQWVNVDRSRVKDSVNVIWWLSKTERPKADNRRVLRPYSKAMEQLLKRQSYNGGIRPGGAYVNPESWKKRHEGAIPPNVLELPFGQSDVEADAQDLMTNFLNVGGSESASRYHRAFKALEKVHGRNSEIMRDRARKHPARFPPQVPDFFVRFLTDEGDLVVDPFAGSNVTGHVAEQGGRKWMSFELHRFYLEPSIARFDGFFTGDFEWLIEPLPLLSGLSEEQISA